MRAALRVLWGAHGVVQRCFDVMALWRAVAPHATGCALPCGHYTMGESPFKFMDGYQIINFLKRNL